MKQFAKLLAMTILGLLSSFIAWAVEGDTHDFSQSLQQLLNNNASISSIVIDQQSYPVKEVIVSYRYNKTIENAVTVAVSVGSTSWGSQNVVGTGSNYTTMSFTGGSTSGAVSISFTNNTGTGTGHGTFYVNKVTLVEGASGGSTSPSISLDASSVNATSAEKEGTINITYNNLTNFSSEVLFVTSNGETSATYDWLVAEINDTDNTKLDYLISENTGTEARTAYLKVYALGDEGDAYSNLVTVSQAGYVKDYATLPFNWEGGVLSDFSAITGTSSSLDDSGSYSEGNAPYRIKFTKTGDYLQVKTDSQPAKVTIGVKMIGGSNNSSITVQESSDGNNFTDVQTLSITGSQNSTHTLESSNVFASSSRYVRLYFTKGSNVGVGPITITKQATDEPAILLSTSVINASAAGSDGTIDVTYKNITTVAAEIFFCNSQGEPATYDWVVADINAQNNVEYVVDANYGGARTAYMKVYALDDEANDVYSGLITISQEKYVEPEIPGNWVLTNLADLTPNDVFVIVGKAISQDTYYALRNDMGTSSPTLVAATVVNNTLSGDVDDNIMWNVSGNITDGFSFYPNGISSTWLYCSTSKDSGSNDNIKVGTGTRKVWALDSDSHLITKDNYVTRYLSIYSTQDWRGYINTDNAATISFYKKVVDAPATINITAREADGRYWATFYTAAAHYALPEGAQAFTMGSDKKLYRVGADGSVIPAGKAVVIIADTQNLTLSVKNAKADATIHGDGNVLLGSDSAVSVSDITSGTPYVLGIVGGKIGFYKFTGESIPERKAYYVVND